MTLPARYTLDRVPWGDCACCDSGKCAAHVEHPDRDPPSRPTTAELVEKIERLYVRALEERVRYLLADVPTVWAEGRSKGFTEGHAAGRQAAYDGEVTNADIRAAYVRGAEAMRDALADRIRNELVPERES